MAPGLLPEPPNGAAALLARHGGILLGIALASIEHGIAHGRPLNVEPAGFAPELRAERASFVTLTAQGKLRGCIGKSQACKPLVTDIAENAYAAAFDDDRFEAVREAEVDDLDVEISVLSEPEPIAFADEADLLAGLRPGSDGLILVCGSRQGLFLPDVWDKLPEPRDFLAQLKVKAGLAADYWSNEIAAQRFTTASTSLSQRAGTP